jgi:hypothetical protein
MGAASPQGVGRRRRAIPTLGNEGASRLGAAAPSASIGRGAAPSGPLTSGRAVAVSRRWGRLRHRESDGGCAPSLPSGNEGASRLGAAAPFVSIGRGAAPSGPLDFRPRSRRFSEMGAASPQGIGRRRRAIPTLGGTKGASRLGAAAPFVSVGRGAAPSGPLTSNRAVAVSRRWGRGSLSVPCGCTKKEGLLPAPR